MATNAGNSLEDAAQIRVRARTTTIRGNVGSDDLVDYYQFTLNRPSQLSVVLRGLDDNADLSLLDKDGRVILNSDFNGKSSEVITPPVVAGTGTTAGSGLPRRLRPFFELTTNTTPSTNLTGSLPLKANTYFLLVRRIEGETDYRLRINAIPDGRFPEIVPVETIPPNRLRTARKITLTGRTQTFEGSVGQGNSEDIYRFTFERKSFLSLFMRDLSDDANVQLIDSNGTVIRESANEGDASETITIAAPSNSLPAGTYYVRVFRASGSTRYDLSMTAIVDTSRTPATGGTTATLVRDINPGSSASNPLEFVVFNEQLFFVADDGINGQELWVSDGTTAGTQLFFNLNPGSAGSNPTDLTVVGDQLFFAATRSTEGTELWSSDGTVAGTSLVVNINSGSAGSNPSDLVDFNGTLFFAATDDNNDRELWRSDGTAGGTSRVLDINSGTTSSNPQELTVVGSNLFFAATNGRDGSELWISDGTAGGTRQLRDINSGAASSNPSDLVNFNGTLYFSATDTTSGRELWQSDGTVGGTQLFVNLRAGSAGSDPAELVTVGSRFFFSANDGIRGTELFSSDGTAAGTLIVRDIISGEASSNPSDLINVNGVLYFVALTTTGRQIFRSDGTLAGTIQVITGTLSTFNPTELIFFNNALFFSANISNTGAELYTATI